MVCDIRNKKCVKKLTYGRFHTQIKKPYVCTHAKCCNNSTLKYTLVYQFFNLNEKEPVFFKKIVIENRFLYKRRFTYV